jgi:hypothetical protein
MVSFHQPKENDGAQDTSHRCHKPEYKRRIEKNKNKTVEQGHTQLDEFTNSSKVFDDGEKGDHHPDDQEEIFEKTFGCVTVDDHGVWTFSMYPFGDAFY